MSSSYEKIRGGKLSFKGGLGPEKTLEKKKRRKKKDKEGKGNDEQLNKDEVEEVGAAMADAKTQEKSEKSENPEKQEKQDPHDAIDTGTGHAPDGKKSKKYEELFPVETRRFGYVVPKVVSREAALDERVKKKADRYCK